MKAPNYVWVCHVCQASNAAGTEACASCGFKAAASGKEIENAKGNSRESSVTELGAKVLLAIVAAPIVLILKIASFSAPIWLVVLVAVAVLVGWLFKNIERWNS
ncbi:hypothetical protein [Uliginosibacterium sediminicola]|uniref:RanBP2-type domain-containing protein n=1 Tax=Uliginosibacterium sediminicola TaxID=2024550 RepID=A0ABU9Z3Q5_9RHOO